MRTTIPIFAASAMLVSGSPLVARSVCGSAPSGSGDATILSQPAGVNNAAACQADCEANGSCMSFVFGMVDDVNECMLFAVAASAIPAQSSSNLVAYDKGCQSVPTTAPTPTNPTGGNHGGNHGGNSGGSGKSGSGKSGSGGNTGSTGNSGGGNRPNRMLAARNQPPNPPKPNPPKPNPPKLAARDPPPPSPPKPNPPKPNPPKLAARDPPPPNPPKPNPPKPGPKLAARNPPQPNPPKPSPPKPNPPKLAVRDTCGGKPSGRTNVSPISTPANIESALHCQKQCKANPSCQSFEFGTLTAGGSKTCRLFAVPASSVPAPSDGQTFAVYGSQCSM